MEEEVLVVTGRLFESLGRFEGFCENVDHYLPKLLDPAELLYLPRSRAEDDPTHKQLIPYVVLRSHDAIFCYIRSRKGGEQRLHDRWSLGVGGHICREDGEHGAVAYDVGFARELAEEVDIQSTYRQQMVGLVYDPSSPVGQVHVGVVHLFDLAEPRVLAVDPALAEGRFRPIADIVRERDRFETWSTLVLDHLLTFEP
ncbi:phosphoesterase [bacterium]|nr:phosphoesterase [bacterium]